MFSRLPAVIEWLRKNVLLSALGVMFGFFVYGGYAFIGGYANRYGASFAGEYDSFKHSVASFVVIDNMLQTYLTEFRANRIGVARFHNNVKDVGNNRLFYVTYESMLTTPGVTSDLDQIKDLSTAVYSPILPSLLKEETKFVWQKDLMDGPLKELMRKRGTRGALFVPVLDLSNHLVGMISMSWLSENDVPPPEERAKMGNEMADAASKIGAYFSGRE